jgi:peptidyl-prolyl cis-trans isomerase SurA
MKKTVPILLFWVASMLAPLAAQEAPKALAESVVARVNGKDISLETYKDYIYAQYGKRGVRDMVAEMLIAEAAESFGVKIDQTELAAKAEEREQGMRKGLDEATFMENLKRQGQSYAMYRANLLRDLRSELLLGEMVLKTRVATDDKIQSFFERQYGQGGVKMRVRQILIMPNILRANLVRGGTKPADIDMAVIKQKARELAMEAHDRLANGEDFAKVAAELSHDRVTKDVGGEMKNYRGRMYGPAFRGALDKLQAGELSGVVESGAGLHVIELIERTETKIQAVRDQIAAEVLRAEPTFQEISGLRNSLLERADLQLW